MNQTQGRIHQAGRGIRIVVYGQGRWVTDWQSVLDPIPRWMERAQYVSLRQDLDVTIHRVRPHLVVLECGASEAEFSGMLARIRATFPLVRILAVVDSPAGAAWVIRHEQEFAGWVSTESDSSVYLAALSSLAQGRRYTEPGVVQLALSSQVESCGGQYARPMVQLSPQEARLLPLLADGLGNREIGQRLSLSEHTVRNYLSRLYGKVGCSSRTSVVSWYLRSSGDGRPFVAHSR